MILSTRGLNRPGMQEDVTKLTITSGVPVLTSLRQYINPITGNGNSLAWPEESSKQKKEYEKKKYY